MAKRFGIFVTISSRYVVKRGELQKDPGSSGTFSGMDRRANGRYSFTPTLYSFPEYFLQRPGKYWWQAFHIDCSARRASCHVLGSIRSFTVG